ncbi:MAG: PQQ-binding-like beta-propeller repeat protein [Anaerolineae bacterium]
MEPVRRSHVDPALVEVRLTDLASGPDASVALAAAAALRQRQLRLATGDDAGRVDRWWLEQLRHDTVFQPYLADLLPGLPAGRGGRGSGPLPALAWRSPALWAPLAAFGLVLLAPLAVRTQSSAAVGGMEPVRAGDAATYLLTTADGTKSLVAVNLRRTSEIERAIVAPGNFVQQLTYLGWPEAAATRAWHYVHPAPMSDEVLSYGDPPFLWPGMPSLSGPSGFLADASGRFWERLPLQPMSGAGTTFATTLVGGADFAYRASWVADEEVQVPAGSFVAHRAAESFTVSGTAMSILSWYAPEVGLVQRDVIDALGRRQQRWQLLAATSLTPGGLSPERADQLDALRGASHGAAALQSSTEGAATSWTWPPEAAIEAAGGKSGSVVTNDLASLSGAPTLCAGVVAVPTQAGLLVGLGLTDGGVRWVFGGPGPIDSSPVCLGDRLTFVTGGRWLYTVDPESGLFLWAADLPGLVRNAPLAMANSLVIGTESGQLAAFRAATGQLLWRRQLGRQPLGAAAAAGDAIVVGDSGGELYAVGVVDGMLRWRTTLGGPILAAPALADGHVYVARADGLVDARAAATGERLEGSPWPISDGDPGQSRRFAPMIVGDELLVLRQSGELGFIDRASGRLNGTLGVFDQVPGGIKAAVNDAPTLTPTGGLMVPVSSGAPYLVTVDIAARRVLNVQSLIPGAAAASTIVGAVHTPLLAEGWQVVVVDSFGVDARRPLEDEP